MVVLIVPSWYKTEEDKTRGSFFVEQAFALAASGHKVYFADVLPVPPRAFFSKKTRKGIRNYEEQGVNIYEYKTCSWGLSRFPRIFAYMVSNNLKRIIRKIEKYEKIEILQAHSYYPAGVVVVNLGKNKRIPSVVTEHYSNVVSGKFDGSVYEKFFRKTYENATKFTTVSLFFKNSIEKKYGIKKDFSITPNILNPLFTYATPPQNEAFHFISIGHLVEGKHFDKIIRALSSIISMGLKADLTVVGVGLQIQKLKNLVEENGINDYVKFVGSVSRERVAEYIKASNCLVSASSFETFGVVYIEALACGRPVITYANGGANELISESNGILIEGEQTVEKLAAAMKKMINNYSNYDTIKFSEETSKLYSQRSISNLYTDIYRSAIDCTKQ